jgi:orotate phosphoribosyltransferase
MPSTSGQNVLPETLAERLRDDLGGQVIFGMLVAHSVHVVPMKEIPASQRPFVPREYVLEDPESLRERIGRGAVVVVEDVFSSGASAKAFCDTLKEAKIQVVTVAGLLGDSRLAAEPQMVSKLQRALKISGIEGIKAKDIGSVLSRGQVATLIDLIGNARGKDEHERIAGGLRGILDSRIARRLGQNYWRSKSGLEGSARKSNSHEKTHFGIPPDAGGQDGSRDDAEARDLGGKGLKRDGGMSR